MVDDESPVLSDALLWETVVNTVHALPGSELYPFTAEWEAARVGGKWFMISTIREKRIVNLKADPQDAIALRENFTSITPGYHMNKKHWITLAPGDDLIVGLVRELVRESYRLVVASLTKHLRPVDLNKRQSPLKHLSRCQIPTHPSTTMLAPPGSRPIQILV